MVLQLLQGELMPFLPTIFDRAADTDHPLEWAINGLFWLKKPGKTGRGAAAYRDICLMEAVSKVYSKILLWRVQEQLVSACIATQFGFLPGKGTADALAAAREIQWRSKMAGHSLWSRALIFPRHFTGLIAPSSRSCSSRE